MAVTNGLGARVVPSVRKPVRSRGARIVRGVAIGCGLIVVLCAGLSYWAISTTPQLSSFKPARATNDATPTIVGHIFHAAGLRASDVDLQVDGEAVHNITVHDGFVTGQVTRKLGSGNHKLALHAASIGVLNRQVSAAWTIVVDTTAPTIHIAAPAAHLTTTASVVAAASSPGGSNLTSSTATDNSAATAPAGGAGLAPATAAAPPQVSVRTIDTRTSTFRIRTEPGARVQVAPSHGTAGDAVADNHGLASVKAIFDDGTQRVLVTARDGAGNISRTRVRVLVDTKAPVLTLPPGPGVVTTPAPGFAATIVDSTPVTVVARLGGQSEGIVVTQTDPTAWRITTNAPLPEGEHQLDIQVTDAVGHVARAQRSFLIDSTEELGAAGLGRGARGNDVRELQHVLSSAKLFSPTSGSALAEWNGRRYGPATAGAVRAWQGQHGLPADGVAGTATIAGLTLHIVISQEAHTLTLFRLGKVYKTYHVAIGQPLYPTPRGMFHIVNKAKNPTWTPPKDSPWAKGAKAIPPGPNNPLGTRWMGLNVPNVGIHGTDAPASIGYSVSHGCIRMAIPDAEDLFGRVQVGTSVEII